MMYRIYLKRVWLSGVILLIITQLNAQWNFKTDYFKIHITQKGFITSMKNTVKA